MLRPGSFLASLLPFVGQRRKFVQQHALLILVDIEPGREKDLHQALEQIGSDLRKSNDILFHQTQTVHYAAWLILPGVRGDRDTHDGPARLLLETNYDGELDQHLSDLVSNCGPALDKVYTYCKGYPAVGCKTPESVQTFLKEQYQLTSADPTAYYIAIPGRTIEDIRNAICVYEEAKGFLDSFGNCRDPNKIRSDLVAHFKDAGAAVRPKRPAITQKGLRRLLAFNLVPGIPFMLLYLFFCWLPLCLIARYFEKKERRQRRHPLCDPTAHPEVYAHLDLGTQNHLCTFATVTPGWFRTLVVKRALALGRILSTRFFILGRLDQMNTVHFARWILIDRQLLFLGTYDGSWSGYLSDFSDQAWGVNLIWSNTIGFPPTRFLVRGGASDLQGFQTQALTHYSPAPVFYSAYRNYSLANIIRCLEFRDELAEAIGMSME
jgi:hypothetical protein